MVVNEYRLEIQFKKVRKMRNINDIPVESRPLECRPAQNVCAEQTLHGLLSTLYVSAKNFYISLKYMLENTKLKKIFKNNFEKL
jgi:hypothetical protein